MFSEEALRVILTEAERIVCDAQSLLDRAVASGQDDLIEAARNNLRLVIANRDRLNKVFSLKMTATEIQP